MTNLCWQNRHQNRFRAFCQPPEASTFAARQPGMSSAAITTITITKTMITTMPIIAVVVAAAAAAVVVHIALLSNSKQLQRGQQQ